MRLNRPMLVFMLALTVIVSTQMQALEDPPAWDAAMGLFPAAATLADNGFDIGAVRSMPGFYEGGPNVHATSWITLLSAAVMFIAPDAPTSFAILHCIHFIMAAATVATTDALARTVMPARLALVTTIALLAFPLFLIQAASLYLETPLTLLTTLAVFDTSRGKHNRGIAWAIASSATKQTGLITVAAVGAMIAFNKADRLSHRAIRLLLLITFSLVAILVDSGSVPSRGAAASFLGLSRNTFFYLLLVPDLLVMMILAGLAIVWGSPGIWRAVRDPLSKRQEKQLTEVPAFATCGLLVSAFVLFFSTAPLIAESFTLPRYYVQILPALFVLLSAAGCALLGQRRVMLILASMLALFIVNHHGSLYPRLAGPYKNDYSVSERSSESRDLLALHQAISDRIARSDPHIPVLYGLPEHFFMSYPRLGYVDSRPTNGRYIGQEPYASGRLWDFPNRFVLIRDFDGHALSGHIVIAIQLQASSNPAYNVKVESLTQGQFHIEWIEVNRKSSSSQ